MQNATNIIVSHGVLGWPVKDLPALPALLALAALPCLPLPALPARANACPRFGFAPVGTNDVTYSETHVESMMGWATMTL